MGRTTTVARALARPAVDVADVEAGGFGLETAPGDEHLDRSTFMAEFKYQGYVRRHDLQWQRTLSQEQRAIPATFGYDGIPGLSREVVERLTAVRPGHLGPGGQGARCDACGRGHCRRPPRTPPGVAHPAHSKKLLGPRFARSENTHVATRDNATRISRRLQRAGAGLAEDQIVLTCDYFGLLAKWNNKINLTALSLDPASDEAIDRLLVEPSVAAKHIRRTDRVAIDLGSGGGSPGFPLKIAAPWLRLVMVEAKARKCAFLREVVRQLPLADVEVANSRFEELLTRPDLHESADLVSVRAVRADQKLWSSAQAFLKPGGRVLWFTAANSSPGTILPPLVFEESFPLTHGSGGQLVVLRKRV